MFESVPFARELAIASAMIVGTVFFHATVISALAAMFRAPTRLWGPLRFFRDAFVLAFESLFLLVAHALEVFAWSVLFMRLDAFKTLEEAVYFAAVCYTTLGFGDVLLPEEWRILAGALAANGMLLFGLSAAFLLQSAARLRISSTS